jgi:hypothetical protein
VLVNPDDVGIVLQVTRVTRSRCALIAAEEPAHVRVPPTDDDALDALVVVRVRAVRVALFVREVVVLAVVGDPVDRRTLHGHRAGDGECDLEPTLRFKRAVGQHAVVTDDDSNSGEEIHTGEDSEVEPVDAVVPKKNDGDEEPKEGKGDGGDRYTAFKCAHGM